MSLNLSDRSLSSHSIIDNSGQVIIVCNTLNFHHISPSRKIFIGVRMQFQITTFLSLPVLHITSSSFPARGPAS